MQERLTNSSPLVRLVCPVCHCTLEDAEKGLRCSKCRRLFPAQGAVFCLTEESGVAWDENARHQLDFYEERYAHTAQESPSVPANNLLMALHLTSIKMAEIDRRVADLQLEEGSRILEVGCGNGWFLRWMSSRHGVRGIGVDISPAAVNLASAQDQSGNAFYAAEVTQLPFEDDTFDLACSFDVIEHLTHQHKRDALQEMVRVVKPGGYLFLYTLHTDDKYTDFWFKRTWARLRGGEEAVCQRERIGYERESGHLRSNFLSVQDVVTMSAEVGLTARVIPFHAMFTSAYDLYLAGFAIPRLINLITRISRALQSGEAPTTSVLASDGSSVPSSWKATLIKIYEPIFGVTMRLLRVVDRPLIAKGHFAGMFVIGQK